jgi:hypothetical protein
VAVATDAGLAVFSPGSEEAKVVALPSVAATGVVAAHDAFWIGDTKGSLVRVDPSTLAATTVATGASDAAVALAAGAQVLYLVAGDGSLTSVDGATKVVRWRRAGLGEVVGSPAEVGETVGVTDRAGRVHLLATADGAARGVKEMGSEARGGLLAVQGRLVAALVDGRVWAYDVASGSLLLDAPFRGTGRFPAADIGGGRMVAPAQGGALALFTLPR